MLGYITDDFGTQLNACTDLTIDAMNRHIAFNYHGVADAIADGTLSGQSTEAALRHFGLIA